MDAGPPWYRNSVIYAVDVKRFSDSDGDGIGDFAGLIDRLDYLSWLGINCLWLLPFYPTSERDNGYDVIDYYSVDDRLGSLDDFTEFLEATDDRGIRVIIDLPVNHTSDEHPWFRKAREGHESYRDYYVWADDPDDADVDAETIFPGQERSVWTYDEEASAYYFHRFYDFEPGLNVSNPDVRREIRKILDYWLRLGVDGFRLDAVNHMVESKGFEEAKPDDPHRFLRDLRQFVTRRSDDAMLLGEADVEPNRLAEFFGDGDELHMLYNFLLDNYLFLGLARGSAEPIVEGLRLLPSAPRQGQWTNFLRNLDELDLERLTESERRDVFEAFAPEENMRIFERGIRRRLAPMLDGDERRVRLAFSLLFSLPGTPMFVYGDEIGMGEDLSQEGRSAVRVPMQWNDGRNAGFSDAAADALIAPVVDEGPFDYEEVNVADQQSDSNSLLRWFRRLVRIRRESPEFGRGTFDLIETEPPSVVVHRCTVEDDGIIAIHNLADEGYTISFELPDSPRLIDVFADRQYEPVEEGASRVEIGAYGYRWLRGGDAIGSSD